VRRLTRNAIRALHNRIRKLDRGDSATLVRVAHHDASLLTASMDTHCTAS